MFNFLRSHHALPQWLHHLTFPPAINESSDFFTSSPILAICHLFYNCQSDRYEVWYLIVLWFNFPDDLECLFICLLAICMSSSEKYLFRSSVHCLFIFLMWNCMSSLYILDINSLLDISFEDIFSHSVVGLFIFVDGFFHCVKAF